MENCIRVQGARVNNLKNISVEIPRDKLVVLTGLSGSGKSSLAFDTIFAEGQRRYVESLSSYARMFLGQMDKPDVDAIDGLSPAISIDQKTTSRNPRSTVGTVTEIYDYLRLLWARCGTPHCPNCGKEIRRQTIDQIVDQIMGLPERTKFQILSPVVRGKKGEHQKVFDDARRGGYARVRVDGSLYELTEENGLRITYDVVSDADTILNLTNHCYFNLDGHGAGPITDHELQLFSHAYTPADAESIPNGDILRVEGTPMDFTEPHLIGERIDADFDQLKMAGGYDHNWVLDNYTGQVRKIAVVKSSDKSRIMEVYTDLPGVQFYSGNSRDFEDVKDGKTYGYRAGLALETQFYPDTPNKPQFPSSVFGPDRPYHTVTEYRFV